MAYRNCSIAIRYFASLNSGSPQSGYAYNYSTNNYTDNQASLSVSKSF